MSFLACQIHPAPDGMVGASGFGFVNMFKVGKKY